MSTTPTRYALFVCGQSRTRKARLVHAASLIPASAALDDPDATADEGSENDDDGAHPKVTPILTTARAAQPTMKATQATTGERATTAIPR